MASVRQIDRQDVVRAAPEGTVPEWMVDDPGVWAAESLELATNVAYGKILPGARPSPEYAAQVTEVTRRRLALGGYRLAAMLNSLFGAS